MNIKDILTDIVTNTHSLGFLPLVKVTSDKQETLIESMAEDRSVILLAKTEQPVAAFSGVFGMANLDKLALHLKNPEYKENAEITVVEAERGGVVQPVGLHFENETKDFQNDYRFMTSAIINERLKSVKFKGATWNVVIDPQQSAIARLKLQASAHNEEKVFNVRVDKSNLVISFGDAASHAGSFVFQAGITGKLTHTWAWPVTQVLSILSLAGDKTMKFSDQGALQITVNTGIAEYNYILPAMAK